MTLTFYHTQENRDTFLDSPIVCIDDNAWLGRAYYFWENEDDAHFWGRIKKNKTGSYDVYISKIEFDNILDTVFNREEYYFWIKQIDKAAKKIAKSTGSKPSLKEINEFFLDRGIWSDIDGILFQDISENPIHFMVNEFQYKKRIQLALYCEEKMISFAHHYRS